jgi:calcium-dependent protein kinase
MSYLLKTLSFLHKNKIVHRDIKPDNILFSVPGKYDSLKLIDFGLSTTIAAKDDYRVGSPYYMAPEILDGKYDYLTDMWSVGVILFVMMTGEYPFPGKIQKEVFEKIRRGTYDMQRLDRHKASTEVQDLIKKLLVRDSYRRISIENALKHPWFSKNLLVDSTEHVIDESILDSISKFAKNNLIQKEILYYLAKISSEVEIMKLKKAFAEFDKNQSGTIELHELAIIFENLGKNIETVYLL